VESGRYSKWITFGSLAALVAGLAAGLLIHGTPNSPLRTFLFSLQPVATVWLDALQVIVFPLMISILLVSIASSDPKDRPGKMGGLTLGCYVSILCLGAIFSLIAAWILAGGFVIDRTAIARLYAPAPSILAVSSPWRWLSSASSSLPRAAATSYLIPLLAATVLAAIVLRHLGAEHRSRSVGFLKRIGDWSFILLRWLFYALPFVVFILVGTIYAKTGAIIARGIGYYLLAVCGTLFAFTGVQYLLAWIGGGISVVQFARSLRAAQATAVTTRSSLASLPPLLEGALNRIGLPRPVALFVLPLSVSSFKASQSIYAPFKLIFLAHLFGVPLKPAALFAFVIGVFLLSFATPGVPSGGSLHTIPLLLALGIPIQGIVLFNSVEAIPDIFETLLNVTADMAVATVVARFLGFEPGISNAHD
jgi:Na+/H+-dicarboxylate symporter